MSGLVTPTTTETVSGRFIDLANFKPTDFYLPDIAWSLSRQARYGGHSMSKVPYSVAQHTVMVSRYVEEALTPGEPLNLVLHKYIEEQLFKYAFDSDPKQEVWQRHQESLNDITPEFRLMFSFHGLLHDFAEAYLMDLPTPVKRLPGLYEVYKKYELDLDEQIFRAFGLPYSKTKWPAMWEFGTMVVGWADMYALAIEAYHFMPSRGEGWNLPIAKPTLSKLYSFRWPISNEQAYEELLARCEELRPKLPPS